MYVDAYVVPVACSPLKSQPIHFAVSNYSHLEGLPLADFPAKNDEQLEVDILIGSDFYWHFVSGDCKRGKPGSPLALESTLGWILAAPVSHCKDMQRNFCQKLFFANYIKALLSHILDTAVLCGGTGLRPDLISFKNCKIVRLELSQIAATMLLPKL